MSESWITITWLNFLVGLYLFQAFFVPCISLLSWTPECRAIWTRAPAPSTPSRLQCCIKVLMHNQVINYHKISLTSLMLSLLHESIHCTEHLLLNAGLLWQFTTNDGFLQSITSTMCRLVWISVTEVNLQNHMIIKKKSVPSPCYIIYLALRWIKPR